jgi:pyruvate/2-oxoglutarate dehydrogenase complex dihydrolipoamide acyltransferase (E2) component
MTEVAFPAVSKQDPEALGVLATWFVGDGERVTAGQVLAEVQVDKVCVDILAPAPGTVRLLVEEEAAMPPGTVIARIE